MLLERTVEKRGEDEAMETVMVFVVSRDLAHLLLASLRFVTRNWHCRRRGSSIETVAIKEPRRDRAQGGVKVEVDVLGSLSLIVLMAFVDVK